MQDIIKNNEEIKYNTYRYRIVGSQNRLGDEKIISVRPLRDIVDLVGDERIMLKRMARSVEDEIPAAPMPINQLLDGAVTLRFGAAGLCQSCTVAIKEINGNLVIEEMRN